MPEDTDRWHQYFLRVKSTGVKPNYELSLRRADGSCVDVHLNAKRMKEGSGGYAVRIALTDITKHRRTELLLKDSTVRYNFVVSALSEAVVTNGRDGTIKMWNYAAERILGLTDEQLQGRKTLDTRWQTIHEDGTPFPADARPSQVVLRTGIPQLNVIMGIRKPDESVSWVSINAVPIFDSGDSAPSAAVVTFTDITEYRAMQAELMESNATTEMRAAQLKIVLDELRLLTANSELALEVERKHIAHELHDDLGQLLAALRMNIGLLKMEFSPQLPELIPRADQMLDILSRAIVTMRGVVAHLRPVMLDAGLVSALEWLENDFANMFKIPCILSCSANIPEIGDAQLTIIFRTIQELLTNVAKHAEASLVHISVQVSDDLLQLSVQDNGIGFDQNAVRHDTQRFGLIGMRERVMGLGGELVIDTAPGMGCCITLNIPIEKN